MNRTVKVLISAALFSLPLTSFAQMNVAPKLFCPSPALAQTLYRGSRDDVNGQVTALQNFLSSHFLLSASFATGYYGTVTEGYVKKFQTEKGISAVGYVGKLTRAAIASECSASTPVNQTPGITPGTTTPVGSDSSMAPTCAISLSADVIKTGDPEIITWTSTNADYAKWTADGYPVGSSGSSVESALFASKTYTLTFYGKYGSTSCSAPVKVVSPDQYSSIVSFTGTSNFVFPGNNKDYLSWSTAHAASCALLGVSDDDGSIMSTVSVPVNSSSYLVQPLIETTYRLQCSMNDGRTLSKDFNISISGDWGGY